MARVSFEDEAVKRFSVWHHRFDSSTNHFRWFLVDCFDNEKEMNALLLELRTELEIRTINGSAHFKEEIVGRIRKSTARKFSFLRR
jgi:hypothetical protein